MKNFTKQAQTIFSATMLVLAAASCIRMIPGEMEITTQSEEARMAFIRGRVQSENFHSRSALKYFNEAIELDPVFALAHLYAGMYAPTSSRQEYAFAAAARLSSNSTRSEQIFIEAIIKREHGDPKAASNLLSRLSKIYPDDARPSFYAGLYYYIDLDDYEMAGEWLNRSLASNPEFGPALNMMGYLSMERGDIDNAADMFARQIETYPEEPNPYDSMGDLFSRAGRHEEAVNYYAQAISLDSTYVLSQRNIGINLVWAHRYEQGRKAIMKSMQMGANSDVMIDGWSAIIRSHLYEWDLAEALRSTEFAIEEASAASYYGSTINFEILRAFIALELRDYPTAATAIEHGRTLIPKSNLPDRSKRVWLQQLLFAESALATARDEITTASELAAVLHASLAKSDGGRDMSLYHLARGKIDLRQLRYRSALGHLKLCDPDDPYSRYYLGLAYEGAGNDDQALAAFQSVAGWNRDGQNYSLVRTLALRKVSE